MRVILLAVSLILAGCASEPPQKKQLMNLMLVVIK